MVDSFKSYVVAKRSDCSGQVAVLLEDDLYSAVVLTGLQALDIHHQVISETFTKRERAECIAQWKPTLLVTESSFIDEADQWLWGTEALQHIALVDDYKPEAVQSHKEEHFKDIWNRVAQTSHQAINDYGWQNSYSGEAFSVAEMEEYVHNFTSKLAPHIDEASRVLEVGCGHGLVLFQLAPKVERYLATDLSEVIIEKNRDKAKNRNLSHVSLEALSAVEIGQLNQSEKFDVVICSSAVHYFPNTVYLEKVVAAAIQKLDDTGVIYLDDLMDLSKKEALVASAINYNEHHETTTAKTDWDSDLFISRTFFEKLQENYPEIVAWEASNKLGKINNELTRYRYDVLLKIDKTQAAHQYANQGPYSHAVLSDQSQSMLE
ncbi:MAG: class I SAM-dependent methyltransferase, partial [Bacteroidota bacterium]